MEDLEAGAPDKQALLRHTAAARAGFLKRVYGLLAVQLLATTAVSATFALDGAAQRFVLETPELAIAAAVGALILLCPLMAYRSAHPHNLVFLLLFNLSQSYSTGYAVAAYASSGMGALVLEALSAALLIFGGLSAEVHVFGSDLSGLGPWVYAGAVSLGLVLLVALFLPNMILYGIAASLGVLVFSGLVLYDTSQMAHYMGPDDAVVAAVQLYLDLVNLFLYLLQCLQLAQASS